MCHICKTFKSSGYATILLALYLLMDMQASYNKIADIKSLDQQLGGIKGLETVYLEGNPAQIQDMVNYRRRIMISLPQLKQIDAT
jgi:protein phosphatase 1 regulatory subunit 7